MTLHIELWHVLSLAVSLVVGYWALVKVIVTQFGRTLDVRFQAQEDVRSVAQGEWSRRFDALEQGQREADKRFNRHLQELPEKYQRREDAIRQEVSIISRLDGLAGLVEAKFQKTDEKIEALRRAQ